MAKIISKADSGIAVSYSRHFTWRDDPGAGFGFPCDKDGNIDFSTFQQAAIDNYNNCVNGVHDVIDDGVQSYSNRWLSYAVLQCDCGEKLELSGFTNTCDCGADYNMSGQLLASRAQWGEETGESLSEILAIK